MAMDNSFTWKGTVDISDHSGMSKSDRDHGGSGSGSMTRGMNLVSHGGGGSGSAIGCATIAPQASPFPIPSTLEPLFKRLKEMTSQNPKQQ